jgi:chloramphenicol 3-O-phosphotransferase
MATWVLLIAALFVALIVGVAVLIVVLATRPKSRATRLPGFDRFRVHESENDSVL